MSWALQVLVVHGYVLLFAWVAIEQLGLPLPSSPLMVAAGALAASGRLGVAGSIAAVVLGCVSADTVWYLLGRRWGDKVVRLICRISFEPTTCVRKTESALGQYGGKTLLVAKFIPGLNVVAAPIAGQSGVPLGRFLALDLVGASLWATVFVGAGAVFGVSVASAGLAHALRDVAALAFAALVLGLVARRVWRHRQFHREAESWRVTAVELKTRLDRGDRFHIVDLRPVSGELERDRTVPGAQRATAREVLSSIDRIPQGSEVVLFCGCPGESAAVALAAKLRKRGVAQVHPLEGGVDAWRESGFPLA